MAVQPEHGHFQRLTRGSIVHLIGSSKGLSYLVVDGKDCVKSGAFMFHTYPEMPGFSRSCSRDNKF